jgi:putative methionine-R-sulfoxide reductase with GAF domain
MALKAEFVKLGKEDRESIMSSIDPVKAAVIFLFNVKKYYDWVGVYVLDNDTLVLGPYKGPPTPHTRIPVNKGICGAAVREQRIINLGDVWGDDRFIACSTTTRSELVVPIWLGDKIIGEIDIDSNMPSAFSKLDEVLVKDIAELIAGHIKL